MLEKDSCCDYFPADSYLEGLIFPPLRGLDRLLVDLVVVVGLGAAGVGGGADEQDEDDQNQDDDEEVLRLRELGVRDPRDTQTRDDDANDLQEESCLITSKSSAISDLNFRL